MLLPPPHQRAPPTGISAPAGDVEYANTHQTAVVAASSVLVVLALALALVLADNSPNQLSAGFAKTSVPTHTPLRVAIRSIAPDHLDVEVPAEAVQRIAV